MTTNEMAEKLATEAADSICYQTKCSDFHHQFIKRQILSTIPLKEMLDCRDALSDALGHLDGLHPHWLAGRRAINALDEKLKGKV